MHEPGRWSAEASLMYWTSGTLLAYGWLLCLIFPILPYSSKRGRKKTEQKRYCSLETLQQNPHQPIIAYIVKASQHPQALNRMSSTESWCIEKHLWKLKLRPKCKSFSQKIKETKMCNLKENEKKRMMKKVNQYSSCNKRDHENAKFCKICTRTKNPPFGVKLKIGWHHITKNWNLDIIEFKQS